MLRSGACRFREINMDTHSRLSGVHGNDDPQSALSFARTSFPMIANSILLSAEVRNNTGHIWTKALIMVWITQTNVYGSFFPLNVNRASRWCTFASLAVSVV